MNDNRINDLCSGKSERDEITNHRKHSPSKRRQHRFTWLNIVLPSVLGAALIGVCIWGITASAKAEQYENVTKSMYSHAYSELVTELNNLEVTLSKLQIVGSKPQYILLFDDVWRSCGACTGFLSQIPASHVDSADTNSFLIRVGDYARALSTKLLHGEAMTNSDAEQISSLRKSCAELAARITKRYENGEYPSDVLSNDGYFESSTANHSTEATRQEYPTLIYDGPFSESAEKAEPKGLKGETVTRNEAYSLAMGYMPQACNLEYMSDSDGDIPAYDFSGTLADSRIINISISKRGGSLVWLMTQATSDISGVPDKSSAKTYERLAREFLEKHDFKNMRYTYAQYYGGIALINFAATQDDIILYNDLIKVWVDRSSGEIVGCDARNYLYSHTSRDIKKPEISRTDAKLLVSENLDIKQTRLALIPASPEKEVLCYEFKGEYDGESFIVYINAWNGEEQQIFRIVNTDDGDLVI